MGKKQASKRNRSTSCTRKTRYGREIDAARAASARGMRPYRCPTCRGWHLTTRPA